MRLGASGPCVGDAAAAAVELHDRMGLQEPAGFLRHGAPLRLLTLSCCRLSCFISISDGLSCGVSTCESVRPLGMYCQSMHKAVSLTCEVRTHQLRSSWPDYLLCQCPICVAFLRLIRLEREKGSETSPVSIHGQKIPGSPRRYRPLSAKIYHLCGSIAFRSRPGFIGDL